MRGGDSRKKKISCRVDFLHNMGSKKNERKRPYDGGPRVGSLGNTIATKKGLEKKIKDVPGEKRNWQRPWK